MGLVVLLLADTPDEPTLGPHALAALADLGVTGAALVRDAHGVGVVLEGWAFDEGDAELAAAAVAGSAAHRTLRSFAHLAVAATASSQRSTT